MGKVDFKYWLISEMAHFRSEECIDGICALDIRIEDWSIDNGKAIEDKIPYIDVWKPIAGKIKENLWFQTDGYGTKMKLSREKPSGDYQFLPDGWEQYAEFYGQDDLLIKAAKYKNR